MYMYMYMYIYIYIYIYILVGFHADCYGCSNVAKLFEKKYIFLRKKYI